ncbi:MAG TPA: hypothetical protein DCG53_04200 [Syntrophus sp. (in: bacteria)]|nr:hypothetical protein [Syntrophus sp. (in: bacteria)]
MVEWSKIADNGSYEEWDRELLKSKDYNIFQSYNWGEFKRKSGWTPLRYTAIDKSGSHVAMAQILIKAPFPGIRFGWAPGGPVLVFPGKSIKDISNIIESLLFIIKETTGISTIRFFSLMPTQAFFSYSINRHLKRPIYKINSGYSIELELPAENENLLSQMTSKHRYYLKKAIGENLDWKAGNEDRDISDFLKTHSDMVIGKTLQSLSKNRKDIENMCSSLRDHVLILNGYIHGEVVTSCLILIFGKKAFYMSAATNTRGREISAAYAMFNRMIAILREKGISDFDFGGIDPENSSAEGVNHFKRGFGGNLVEYVGEWEWSSSEMMRYAINGAIRYKAGRL